MAYVKVKDKFQVTLPAEVRENIDVEVGDFLEVKAVKGKITLEPKSIIDKGLATALEDVRMGRTYGPFDTAEEMIASLHQRARRRKK